MLCFKRSSPGVNLNISTSTSRLQICPAVAVSPPHKTKIDNMETTTFRSTMKVKNINDKPQVK